MKEFISTRNLTEEKLEKIFLTLNNWTNLIKNNENFTFVKFGDGELICMMGQYEPGNFNCDFHPYSVELANKLRDAWFFFNTKENVYVAEWDNFENSATDFFVRERQKFLMKLLSETDIKVNFVNYEIVLQTTLSQAKFDFLKSIKESTRKKIFVGPKRLEKILEILNVDSFVEVPIIDAFSSYNSILSNLLYELEDNSIILFSSGMPAKSFIHKSMEFNEKITCIDIGSGFDNFVMTKQTREGQLPFYVIKNYYADL